MARLGPDRGAAELDAAQDIIVRCGGLPLALAIVAARAASRPQFPLATLADELSTARGGLDALDSGDAATNVRLAFSLSYRALTPPAARLFRLLGLHPGPDIAVAAAASLAGLPAGRLRPLLGELTGANLFVEHLPGRFTFHDLVRAYAADQADVCEPEEARSEATHRLLDHYLHTAHAANMLLAPTNDKIALTAARPGTVPESPASHEEALEWFDAEQAVLLAVVEHAAATGWDTHTWQLAWAFTDHLNRKGDWRVDIATQHAALTAARRLADPAARARAHRLLGLDHTQLGDFAEADTHLRGALELAVRAGDARGQAHAHNYLAFVCDRQGNHRDALRHSQEALVLYRAVDHTPGQADVLNAMGWSYAQLGDHHQALVHCGQALAVHQQLGSRAGRAATLDSLGYAHHHLGQYEQAVACYHEAIQLHHALGNRYYEANALMHLGDTYDLARGPDAAAVSWQQALDILVDLHHADADEVRSRLHRRERRG